MGDFAKHIQIRASQEIYDALSEFSDRKGFPSLQAAMLSILRTYLEREKAKPVVARSPHLVIEHLNHLDIVAPTLAESLRRAIENAVTEIDRNAAVAAAEGVATAFEREADAIIGSSAKARSFEVEGGDRDRESPSGTGQREKKRKQAN